MRVCMFWLYMIDDSERILLKTAFSTENCLGCGVIARQAGSLSPVFIERYVCPQLMEQFIT